MSKDIKQQIIQELDKRIRLLEEHQDDVKPIITGNQYEELNHALSKVISVPLLGELNSVKEFVQEL